jgi:hypothetical protein
MILPRRLFYISIRVIITAFSLSSLAMAQAPARTPAPKTKPAPAAAPSAPPEKKAPLEAKGFSRVEVTPQYKEQFQNELRVAVVVAPSYRNSGLNALRFTYVDALELKAEFERQGYKVFLISPSEATADNVRKALQDSKQLLDGNNQGTLMFAFSGHGFQTAKGNYLVTVGVTPETIESEALSLDEVQKLMTASGARRKVILVDACRNDPDAKSTETPRTFAQFQDAEGTSILLSTRPGGFSYEDSDLGHGIFSYYVLEGMRGKAAGKDGFVTFFDLQKYVENGVLNQALKKERVQRPFVMGERSGDFLLATAPPPKPGEIAPVASGSQAVDSNSLVLREIGGGNRSFFAIAADTKLTLVDSKTLNPYVELTDTGLADLAPGYKHFKGTGGNKETIDAAIETKGQEIIGVKARIGTPCPQETACSTAAQIPLLPGEKVNQARSTASTVANAATSAKNGLSKLGFGRGAANLGKTEVGAQTTASTIDSTNPLMKSQWKSFDLTSNLPKKK